MGVETLAIAAVAASVVGAGVQAYGQYQAGQAAKQQGLYQQQIANLNAQTALRNQELAKLNASYVEAAGARAAEDRARRIRATIGSQRAALAANGLLVDTGSGLDLQQDTAALGSMAIAEIRDNASRQAAGYRIQGVNAENEALAASLRGQAYAASAESAGTAGWLSAGGTLIGGAATTFDRWADMRRTGVPITNPPAVV